VLAAMEAGLHGLEYKSIVRKAPSLRRPGISISFGLHRRFPGETRRTSSDSETRRTKVRLFDGSFHLFTAGGPVNPRGGLPDVRPQQLKLARLCSAAREGRRVRSRISKRMVGTRQRILVEGVSPQETQESCRAAPETTACQLSRFPD